MFPLRDLWQISQVNSGFCRMKLNHERKRKRKEKKKRNLSGLALPSQQLLKDGEHRYPFQVRQKNGDALVLKENKTEKRREEKRRRREEKKKKK